MNSLCFTFLVLYFACLGFSKTHLRAGLGQHWFMGEKFKRIWSVSSIWIRWGPRPFLSQPFYTHCIFSLWTRQWLNLFSRHMPQTGIVWVWLSWPCVDISISLHAHTHWEVPPAENLFYINFPANLHGSRSAGARNVRSAFWLSNTPSSRSSFPLTYW